MRNIVLAALLALIAVPALAVGPESFTVDVSRGYAVQRPGEAQEQARSNWAPRGQQAQQEASSEENAAQPQTRQPRAMKASGKSHRRHGAAAVQQPGSAARSGSKTPANPSTATGSGAPANGESNH